MKPDELVHFADRIAQLGVYEGLSRPIDGPDIVPDGLWVRLDDGTRTRVVGRCVDTPEQAQSYVRSWAADGPVLHVAHEHKRDMLHWRDRYVHVESCALARA